MHVCTYVCMYVDMQMCMQVCMHGGRRPILGESEKREKKELARGVGEEKYTERNKLPIKIQHFWK